MEKLTEDERYVYGQRYLSVILLSVAGAVVAPQNTDAYIRYTGGIIS